MSVIPATSTAGPDIPIILDREVITRLVKGLLSILHPADFKGPLSGAAKTKVDHQVKAYTYALSCLGLPNHVNDFAIRQTVHDILKQWGYFVDPQDSNRYSGAKFGNDGELKKKVVRLVLDGIVDRLMGLTTEDHPEGLPPEDMPNWWQARHPAICFPREPNTVRIVRVED